MMQLIPQDGEKTQADIQEGIHRLFEGMEARQEVFDVKDSILKSGILFGRCLKEDFPHEVMGKVLENTAALQSEYRLMLDRARKSLQGLNLIEEDTSTDLPALTEKIAEKEEEVRKLIKGIENLKMTVQRDIDQNPYGYLSEFDG